MILYLTSSFLPYKASGGHDMDESEVNNYGFFEDMRSEWPQSANILYVPCDPDASEENENQKQAVVECFEQNGLGINEVRILPDNKENLVREAIAWSDVIYLAGGHAPTQLAFMKRIGLKDALRDYGGIVVGLGAGSINAAFYVYLLPEFEGEAKDPNYLRFSEGLDLTNIQMIPHRELINKKSIDGLDYINDIVLPDSFGCRFYIVSDGSYFKVKNGRTSFKGNGEIIEDGKILPLAQGPVVPYMGYVEQPVIKTLLSEGYDMVVTVYKPDERCEVYYLCDQLARVFENSKLSYKDICNEMSHKVIEDDREFFIEQVQLPVILKELREKGEYVRTVYVDVKRGRRAKNIRAREIPGYPEWVMILYVDITTFLYHDWMTDEYARTGFMEKAQKYISEITDYDRYSLVYTNVKGFKAVNELFGDKNGDLVIFQTRDALKNYLKPEIIGRLESDHFVVITENKNLSEKNLKDMCSQVFKAESKEYNYEIRCGIYSINSPQIEITQLLAGAKLAEKNIGSGKGNRFYAYYDDAMKENYVKQQFLLSDFERGITDNEFEPYYQPIVETKTGRIVSSEMLIRWRHRDLGMVSPGDFIPVIESEGKISPLDSFMVERGMEFISRCLSEGKRAVPCAINLSRVDFYDYAFIERIFERIKELHIDPCMIRFEVTESAYADLESKALEYLDRMKKSGIRILLDDYGSGMSSLSMLETFDFDIVKLDIGFIRKIGKNDKVESIIVSTINLAHSIGAKVTAEGVESEEQLTFLRNAGCDYIQGYYFYKPMPENEFAKLL